MQRKYVDAHCHLQFDAYAEDAQEVIERMRAAGVAGIVAGVDLDSSRRALALAEKYEHLFASVGLHPNRVGQEPFDAAALRALAAHPKAVAIGECGLDFFRPAQPDDSVKNAQKEILRAHGALAAEAAKPLIIHARPSRGTQDAYQDLIALLAEMKAEHPTLSGDVHFFVGGRAEAAALVALGFMISYTAVITFARDYDDVIRAVPLGSLLAETDAPYVAPAPRRGERNDPLAVADVVRSIADIRGADTESVRRALLANAARLFRIPELP